LNVAVLTAVEVGSSACHIGYMTDPAAPLPYSLTVRPCTIRAGHYRWDIRQGGRLIQSSVGSFL